MANTQLHKPARVERAWDRLEKAVSRLDAALAARDGAGPDPETERALEEARDENVRLRETADDLSRRLDGAIARLRTVLEA